VETGRHVWFKESLNIDVGDCNETKEYFSPPPLDSGGAMYYFIFRESLTANRRGTPVIIANPIYDATFKRLLENDRAAKFFIGAILGCEVLSLEPTSQERTEPVDIAPGAVTLFRMDFAATIKTKEEGEKRVIIEMQKAKVLNDVFRFRKYLGSEYTVSKLPIIAIYILGFTLSVDSPAFGNVPKYRDLLTNEELHVNDLFVEQLTHSAYFVQTPLIKPSLNTKLYRLLSIFEQNNFIDADKTMKDYSLALDDPDVKTVIDVLHYVAADPQLRKELDKERYYQEAMEDAFGEMDRQFAEKKREIEDLMRQKVEAKQREEEAKQREEKARQEKEEANRETEETKHKFVKWLKEKGTPLPEIAKITNLTEAEIERI
jgi:hypothetical protein